MRVLEIKGKTGETKIVLGESASEVPKYAQGGEIVLVMDERVRALHGEKFKGMRIVEIGEGEEAKTLESVQLLYGKFLELGLDRGSCVVAVGGGIACDLAGFAAATYLRGVEFGFVPTTLLAQADASVGGKNGVNFKGYKNLIGTFSQPKFVLCDFGMLESLPRPHMQEGMAEMIKSAAIGDAQLFSFLEDNCAQVLSLKRTAIEKAVHDCLVVKTKIVQADETEKGERRKLNFGHTVGHALEKISEGKISHGKAVAIGMCVAAKISVAKGMMAQKDADRLEELLKKAGLPTKMDARDAGALMQKAGALEKADAQKEAVLDAMRKDKKMERGMLNFVLLEGIGKAKVVQMGPEEIGEHL